MLRKSLGSASSRRVRRRPASPARYIVSKIDVRKALDTIGSASARAGSLLSAFADARHRAAAGLALEAAAARARAFDESVAWLTRAYFVSYAVGQVLPTGVGGDASRIYETTKRHPGFGLADRRLGRARARDRRRRDAPARGDRAPARDRPLPDRAVPLDRGALRRRRRSSPARSCFSARPRAATCARVVPLLRRLRVERVVAGASTRASTATGTTRARCSSSPGSPSRRRSRGSSRSGPAGRAVGVELLGPAVHRARAAALPRDARAVHDQRARRARGVLRQLPRRGSASAPTTRSRPASSSS